jgi:zinc/manganese transport system permease protein
MIDLLMYPLLTCIILVLIHVAFGQKVLSRGIIFIDLAFAQWAALGYLVGHYYHIQHPIALFLCAFGFTVLASILLTLLKPLYQALAVQEAVIGVTYIAAISLALGIIVSTGMDGHHLDHMLKGHLLFIQSTEFWSTSVLYLCIGFILWWQRPFLSQPSLWSQLCFYALFGLVVTSSVQLVGTLLVFTYLVLPLLTVMLFTPLGTKQCRYAWLLGGAGSVIGLIVATKVNIPPSFAVIFVLLSLWIVATIIKGWRRYRLLSLERNSKLIPTPSEFG